MNVYKTRAQKESVPSDQFCYSYHVAISTFFYILFSTTDEIWEDLPSTSLLLIHVISVISKKHFTAKHFLSMLVIIFHGKMKFQTAVPVSAFLSHSTGSVVTTRHHQDMEAAW